MRFLFLSLLARALRPRYAFPVAILPALLLASCGGKGEQTEESGNSPTGPEPLPAAGAPVRPKPMTTDPVMALKHMLDSYRELKSLHMTSDTDVEIKLNQSPIKSTQFTTIRFLRQPARIKLSTRDTQTGTIELTVDGRNMYFYSGTDNAYQKRAFTGDLAQAAEKMDQYAYQILSPLAFQHGAGLPHGVTGLRYEGMKAIGTKKAHVISGRFSDEFVSQFGMSMQRMSEFLRPGRSVFAIWLEKDTYLLLQSRVEFRWNGSREETIRLPAAKDPHIFFTEKVVQFIPNAALKENQFQFSAPAGAKEVFVERKGQ